MQNAPYGAFFISTHHLPTIEKLLTIMLVTSVVLINSQLFEDHQTSPDAAAFNFEINQTPHYSLSLISIWVTEVRLSNLKDLLEASCSTDSPTGPTLSAAP